MQTKIDSNTNIKDKSQDFINNILQYLNKDFYDGFPFKQEDLLEADYLAQNIHEILNGKLWLKAIIEKDDDNNNTPKAIIVNTEFFKELIRAWSFVDDLEISNIIEERKKNKTHSPRNSNWRKVDNDD